MGFNGYETDNKYTVIKEENVRLIGLETHGSNYPAIEFYKKNGYKIDGVDFSRYPKRENESQEVAIIMNKILLNTI